MVQIATKQEEKSLTLLLARVRSLSMEGPLLMLMAKWLVASPKPEPVGSVTKEEKQCLVGGKG